jgi:hypothetical protein
VTHTVAGSGITQFDGRVLAGTLSVWGPSAVLGGTGTTGPLTAFGSGVVNPGSSTGVGIPLGVLTTGDLTNFAVHGGVGIFGDRVDVRGAVLLGGLLRLRPDPGRSVPRGAHVTIVSNDGTDAVTGTFDGLPEGAVVSTVGGVPLRVTYRGGDGNDVELYTVAPPLRWFAAGAGPGGGPHVKVYDAAGTARLSFLAYDPAFRGGVTVALGDVTGDGVPEVVTGAGPGGGPHVRVFSWADGRLLGEWLAYDPAWRGGVAVAAGDVDGDGRAEVVTGAGPGGGPHVKVFAGLDGRVLNEFLAYGAAFRGGVTVAVGDVNADGLGDVVTGAGPGGGPHVKVFGGGGPVVRSFLAYGAAFRGGVAVAAADLTGDGSAEVVTGPGAGAAFGWPVGFGAVAPAVRVFDGATGAAGREVVPFGRRFTGGVRVAAADLTGDGRADLVVAAGPGGGPHVRVLDAATLAEVEGFYAFDPAFTGGVFVG